jgi:galactose mutarotase-like enzyme
MKQHGFARNLGWTTDRVDADLATATLSLRSSDATRTSYPWDFEVTFTFAVRGAALRIDQTVRNLGPTRMPFGVGFHPYFRVDDKARAQIPTSATAAFDNVTKRIVPFTGFDLTEQEVDLHLLDHRETECTLRLADGAVVRVRTSQDFARWVVWTLAGKDFVCVEPWTCPGNALNSRERLIVLEPGGEHTIWTEFAFDAPSL